MRAIDGRIPELGPILTDGDPNMPLAEAAAAISGAMEAWGLDPLTARVLAAIDIAGGTLPEGAVVSYQDIADIACLDGYRGHLEAIYAVRRLIEQGLVRRVVGGGGTKRQGRNRYFCYEVVIGEDGR